MSETEKSQLSDDEAIEAKRANLLNAKGDLAVGRRETPAEDPEEAKARTRRIIISTALCGVILIAVFVVIKVLAADISL